MQKIIQRAKTNIHILRKLLPLIAIIIPCIILYSLDPASFDKTWKGRTFYLFFLWLISLETILSWEELRTDKIKKLKSMRTVAFTLAFLMPTVYVVAANYWGLNAVIADLAAKNKIEWAGVMPLSTEYLIFTMFFALIIPLGYGVGCLRNFSVSTFFLGIIGIIYTVDNIYPRGSFTPFQIIVPTTATLAANVLNLMGYQTKFEGIREGMPVWSASDSKGRSSGSFAINWPCSGIDSLLIYTVTILLFLKNTAIPWKHRIIYFIIGAIVTYFANILRIVTIFVISINTGGGYTPEVARFHDYYGPLYSITWIISYPLIIIGSRTLWAKIRSGKTRTKSGFGFSS